MKAVVFLGPTLSVKEAEKDLRATYLPPVARGDVYRATLLRPTPLVIAIIDGSFAQQASVNHKEILWAMAQGIHVFGASSMGALRAAELADFGMVGIGQIYQWLKSGEIEDDDEVAIGHGPKQANFVSFTDAMVDMRAIFRAARVDQVISNATEDLLLQASKKTFYLERTYERSLSLAMQMGADRLEIKDLEFWLQANKRCLKKADARLLLKTVERFIGSNPECKTVDYVFERTEFWNRGLGNFELRNTASRADSAE